MRRFSIAFDIIQEELVLFTIITSILIVLSAAGIYYFEHEDQPTLFSFIFHSFWWAVVTLTTVGYGDVYPINMSSKLFTFFVLIVGVGFVTIPAGLIVSSLSKSQVNRRRRNTYHTRI